MFLGAVYASLYTSGTVALALHSLPLVRQKTTVFYHRQDWPELYQTRDFVVETGSHGYPEKIIETYAKEIYTRLPNVERPMLLTEPILAQDFHDGVCERGLVPCIRTSDLPMCHRHNTCARGAL